VFGERLYPELPYHMAFFGRIHPRGTKISVHEVRVVHYLDEQRSLKLNMVPYVTNSKVSIDCYFDNLIPDHASIILPVVISAIRGQVDLISFMMGAGTTIILDWMKDYNGVVSDIALVQHDLASICTSFTEFKNYKELKEMATAEKAMALALNDLILAQTIPNLAEVNCARAMEGVRQIIAGQGTEAKLAWPIMQTALNVDRSYREIITNNSFARRHGQFKTLPPDTIQEILRRSWTIMDRFFHYRLRGDTQLPIDEFRLLTE
jgi:hypothetical protein